MNDRIRLLIITYKQMGWTWTWNDSNLEFSTIYRNKVHVKILFIFIFRNLCFEVHLRFEACQSRLNIKRKFASICSGNFNKIKLKNIYSNKFNNKHPCQATESLNVCNFGFAFKDWQECLGNIRRTIIYR